MSSALYIRRDCFKQLNYVTRRNSPLWCLSSKVSSLSFSSSSSPPVIFQDVHNSGNRIRNVALLNCDYGGSFAKFAKEKAKTARQQDNVDASVFCHHAGMHKFNFFNAGGEGTRTFCKICMRMFIAARFVSFFDDRRETSRHAC